MYTAKEIWEGIGTYDRIKLIDKYGKSIMPYELQRPSDEQVISVLSAAWEDKYLITPFSEYRDSKLNNFYNVIKNNKRYAYYNRIRNI